MELKGLLRYYCRAILYVCGQHFQLHIAFWPLNQIGKLSPLELSSATANHSYCCFKF